MLPHHRVDSALIQMPWYDQFTCSLPQEETAEGNSCVLGDAPLAAALLPERRA
jgi:hypothetical protein